MASLTDRALEAYASRADELTARYDTFDSAALFGGFVELLPAPPGRCLDIGAGSGRDAAWLQGLGYQVTAAEPLEEFREAIAKRLPGMEVVDTRLPDLGGLSGPYNLITVSGVWQHLDLVDRPGAWRRIAELLGPAGTVIVSLRHGQNHPAQPIAEIDVDQELDWAQANGLTVLAREARGSIQPGNIDAGVTWTWIALQREGSQ